jgi:TPR repeat protein
MKSARWKSASGPTSLVAHRAAGGTELWNGRESLRRGGASGCTTLTRRFRIFVSSPLPPDPAKAWVWYQKGADAGEPDALARFAERDERNALTETDTQRRNALLLQAFRFYTAASVRAHGEDWPDDAWRNWRYRRATLARLLAREGRMQQVADTYQAERDRWATR